MFRLKTLQLYILRQFVMAFGLALLACTLFMLLAVFFLMSADLEQFGMTPGQIALLTPFLLPKPLAYSIPLAAMIAATMVFGRLSSENEILAAQAGGAPLRVLALPVLLCACLLCIVCLWFNETGLRWGFSTIKNEILQIDKPEFFKNLDKPGCSLTVKLDEGNTVRINLLPHVSGKQPGTFRKPIHIAYFQNQQVGQTVLAADYDHHYEKKEGQNGTERNLSLTLRDAQILGEQPKFCGEINLDIRLPDLSELNKLFGTRGQNGWWQNYENAGKIKKSLPMRQKFFLQRAADFGAMAITGSPADPAAPALGASAWSEARIAQEAIYGNGGAVDRMRADATECWRKIALSLLPFSMAMLGIGLGLLVQKSQRLVGFLLGILTYALVYYPMMIVSKELATANKIGLWALCIPNVVLCGMGYGLWRAYERSWLGDMPGWLVAFGMSVRDGLSELFVVLKRPFLALRDYGVGLSRHKTDGYIAGSFIVPLLIVLFSVGALFTALDLVEHGGEVIDGVLRANDPLAGLPARSELHAILDVLTFYCIRALEITCDLLPLLLLLAGVLCVSVAVRNNEHLILKSAGIPLQRAFRPIIWITIIFSFAVILIRETLMPDLIMRRDYLKPMVYHRSASPTALALHTIDANGKSVLFEMSQYSSAEQKGINFRVYLLSGKIKGRTPMIVADHARWDDQDHGWRLSMDSPNGNTAFHSGAASTSGSGLVAHGYLFEPEVDKSIGVTTQEEVRVVKNIKKPMPLWRGAITPSFLESDRLGMGVMRLDELRAASAVKPELGIEWWRRVSEGAMGVFLLWMVIPLLLREEARGPLIAVASSILLGALYWGLNMSCVEIARKNMLPVWAPVLPHALFLLVGLRRFYIKMET